MGEGRAGSRRIGQLTAPRRRAVLRRAAIGLALGCGIATRAGAQALVDGAPPPFVGTPPSVVERLLALANVGPDDRLVDLGSGDGRIVIHAAKRYGARALGVELDAALVAKSRETARREGLSDRVRFEQGDALAADLSEATVLTLYLAPELNEKLLPRILATMRPGARVVSHDFPIANWTPDRVERVHAPEKHGGRGGESVLMLWTVPARAAGRWRGTIGVAGSVRTLDFSLAQQFQFLEAGLHEPGRLEPQAFRAELAGDRIVLHLPASSAQPAGRIDARVDGDVMRGHWRAGGDSGSVPFEARRVATRPGLY